MGNSVAGRAPSETFKLLASMFKKRTELVYDAGQINNLGMLELNTFQTQCDMIRYRKTHPEENIKDLLAKYKIFESMKVFYDEMYRLTKDKSYNFEVCDDKSDDEHESVHMVPMHCDIQLLDLIYGMKQCEYALRLVKETEEEFKKNSELNKLDYMLSLYEKDTNDLIVQKLRNDTVIEVEPCKEALRTWWNWSI